MKYSPNAGHAALRCLAPFGQERMKRPLPPQNKAAATPVENSAKD
jgi:hypothetical protein